MLISLNQVSLLHDDTPVLNDVNLTVDAQDFVYIVGKVGSGKSTLLKALYGELPIAAGQAEILGHDLTHLRRKHIPALRRRLGIIFQDFQLMRDHTVAQNLDFVLRATGWKKRERPERINQVLQLVGLLDRAANYPHELSGGEQQRVCIARALLNNPDIILADEPIGNLDPDTGRTIMTILQTARQQGAAVVMVTHNLSLLTEYPGTVYRCADGGMQEATADFNFTIELDN